MPTEKTMKAELYRRYPLGSVVLYNGITILHFLLGATGIAVGYGFSPRIGNTAAALYFVLSAAEMYIVMPLVVCPNCSYFGMKDSRCVSALNLWSRRIARQGDQRNFAGRAEGLLCPNNLYAASLILPLLAIAPALFVHFSPLLLATFAALVALLVYRFFVVFPKIACLHCMAKYRCPQAAAMGVRDL